MTVWIDSELALMRRWIIEREHVRRAKEGGCPKPWTADPFVRDFRWCNVRRLDDRVSRWLFDRWYPRRAAAGDTDLAAALLARLVNWPDALDEIVGSLDTARSVLRARAARGQKVFTSAYVVPGVPGRSKVDSVCDLVDAVRAQAETVVQPSMRATWARLMRFDGIGSFLAGQVVADVAHRPIGRSWPDVDDWAPLGPGSARGINRLRGIAKDKAVRQSAFETLLPELITALRPTIAEIWNDRGLQAMDIQNCLCEFDKYRRLQLQEGRVRASYNGGAPTAPQPNR